MHQHAHAQWSIRRSQEVVLFLLTPGSKVRLHNGGSNAPINLSLGLTGSAGAFLEVAGEVGHLDETSF